MDDPPPPDVNEAALRAREMHVPGSAVADISYDSVVDSTEVATTERRLTFTTQDREVEVVVRPGRHGLRLIIRLRPEAAATVRTFDGGPTQALDAAGSATLDIDGGLTSLVLEPAAPGEPPIQTAWVVL